MSCVFQATQRMRALPQCEDAIAIQAILDAGFQLGLRNASSNGDELARNCGSLVEQANPRECMWKSSSIRLKSARELHMLPCFFEFQILDAAWTIGTIIPIVHTGAHRWRPTENHLPQFLPELVVAAVSHGFRDMVPGHGSWTRQIIRMGSSRRRLRMRSRTRSKWPQCAWTSSGSVASSLKISRITRSAKIRIDASSEDR